MAAAYAFCNSWNHDRLLPKAYVHELDDGELLLVGEYCVDLEYGASETQLSWLVDAVVWSAVMFGEAATNLP